MLHRDDDSAIPRCAFFYWAVAAVIGWLVTWSVGAGVYQLVGSWLSSR